MPNYSVNSSCLERVFSVIQGILHFFTLQAMKKKSLSKAIKANYPKFS